MKKIAKKIEMEDLAVLIRQNSKDIKELASATHQNSQDINNLAIFTKRGFDEVHEKLIKIDSRLDGVDNKIKNIENKMATDEDMQALSAKIGGYISNSEERTDRLYKWVSELDSRINVVEDKIAGVK